MDWPGDKRSPKLTSSIVFSRHNDGGIPKPTKSLFWRGFLKPLPPVAMGSSKEASDMTPPPSVPTVRVPGVVLNIGLDSGGLPRLEVSLGNMNEGLQASDLRPLSVMSSKPMQRYSRKLRDSWFLKMDDSLMAEVNVVVQCPTCLF
jgi:hypothetical protein